MSVFVGSIFSEDCIADPTNLASNARSESPATSTPPEENASPLVQERPNETVVTSSEAETESKRMDEEIIGNEDDTAAVSTEASESVGSMGGLEPEYDSAFVATPDSISEPASLDAIDLDHDSSVAGSEPGTPCDAEKSSTDGDVDSGVGSKKKRWWRFWKGKEGEATNRARKGQSPKAELQLVSTTGLVMEGRPGNLPVKSEKEERKHRAQYEQMIQQAKKKGEKVLCGEPIRPK